jgi:probable addiction module antidote protein
MMVKFCDFDAADWLNTKEDVEHFLSDAFDTGDSAYIAECLGVVARSKGMSNIAKETGISREQLYKSFGHAGNPTLRTFLKLMNAINTKLTIRLV